jgi:hypothetical protein
MFWFFFGSSGRSDFVGFQSDDSVFLGSDSFGFSRIICALQQYKDAKPFMLIISYSTEAMKPSIFGVKKPLSGIYTQAFKLTV